MKKLDVEYVLKVQYLLHVICEGCKLGTVRKFVLNLTHFTCPKRSNYYVNLTQDEYVGK